MFVLKYNFPYKCTNYLSLFSAFQKALSFQGVEALYLLTDGKPDTSCSLILKEIGRLRKKQDIKIHTISFSCADRYMVLFKNRKKPLKITTLFIVRSLCYQVGTGEVCSDTGNCHTASISYRNL